MKIKNEKEEKKTTKLYVKYLRVRDRERNYNFKSGVQFHS